MKDEEKVLLLLSLKICLNLKNSPESDRFEHLENRKMKWDFVPFDNFLILNSLH